MPLRNAVPLTFNPGGCADALELSEAAPGAMLQLSNLVRAPQLGRAFVPRPASVQQTAFSGFSTPGFVSNVIVVGDIAYGTIASARNAGKDEPFAFDITTGTFLSVAGITSSNVPASPSSVGDWTPPILQQIGSRIVVTHPGFPGGAVKFGWFDTSGFTATTTGNAANGSPIITGNPEILGVQPGMTISGTDIPAGATVVNTTNVVTVTQGTIATGGTTTIANIPNLENVTVGQQVAGEYIPTGTTVTAISIPTASVTISNTITLTQAGTVNPLTFTGSTIVLSQSASGTASGVTLSIAGGTPSSPLWGAGDCQGYGLPSVPVGVAQMNGRAYFACGVNGIPFSDSLYPCQRTNASQALLPSNGIAVTALGQLMLSTLTGGVVQAIIAFQSAVAMQQITGDIATLNLAMNALPIATGTLAPLSIQPCADGLAFMSPTGLRFVTLAGVVTPPVGMDGKGITVPFQFALYPSRICAAANTDQLRISVQNGALAGQPWQEWWYDLVDQIWTGPHTFPATAIAAWRSTFLLAPAAVTASLWQSDPYPSAASVFTENDVPLNFTYQTPLLPDNKRMAENGCNEGTIAALIPFGQTFAVSAYDEAGNLLDSVSIMAPAGGPAGSASSLWGSMVWGTSLWGASGTQGNLGIYRQWPIPWHQELVFKQMTIAITGNSGFGALLAALRLRYAILGYLMQPVGGASE